MLRYNMSNTSTYLKVVFATSNAGQTERLIALLSDAGFEGFQEMAHQLEAYVPLEQANRTLLEGISLQTGISFTEELLPATNWNEEWEKGYRPVVVGQFCSIRASFHPSVTDTRYEILITPKMSFGTGHHATTFLMVQAMESLDLGGQEVLDFGTGTGVLAILAEKAGALRVDAIDCDDWSIDNARENLAANHCRKINLYQASNLDNRGRYGVILANINKNVILSQLESLSQHLQPGGELLISGVLYNDRFSLQEALGKFNFKIISTLEKEDWLLVRARYTVC